MSIRPQGIFLVGCPRSGTTLLQSLLGCSPDLSSFPESHLFARGLLNYAGLTLPRRPANGEIARFLKGAGLDPALAPRNAPGLALPSRAAKAFLDTFDSIAGAEGQLAWLEKTPRHLHYIGEIEAAAKLQQRQIRFVHLIRDGVAVAPSLINASQNWRRTREIEGALARWQKDIAISRANLGRAGHVFIAYEDLVGEPEAGVLSLARQIGIRMSAKDLEHRQKVHAKVVGPGEVWKLDTANEAVRPLGRTASHVDVDTIKWLEAHIDRTDYALIRRSAKAQATELTA